MKAQLWVVVDDMGDWLHDDKRGCLFVSVRMAERARDKHAPSCTVQPCELDDDLAQMSKLYNEGSNKKLQ